MAIVSNSDVINAVERYYIKVIMDGEAWEMLLKANLIPIWLSFS